MEEAADDDDYALLFGTPAEKPVEKPVEKAEKKGKKSKALPAAVGVGEASEA